MALRVLQRHESVSENRFRFAHQRRDYCGSVFGNAYRYRTKKTKTQKACGYEALDEVYR